MSESLPPPPVGSESSGPAPTSPATPTDPTPVATTGGGRRDDPLRHSRTSGAWTAVILAAVLLVLLIVFIVQNTESVDVEFFGFDGSVPLAAALLIATVVGMAVVAAVGSLRILQLRRRIKRERR